MEFLTSAIASGFVYDMLQKGIALKATNIKEWFKGWLIDEILAKTLESKFATLNVDSDLSQSAIAKRIESSEELKILLSEIKPSSSISITQNHSGSGDNVFGNKIVY